MYKHESWHQFLIIHDSKVSIDRAKKNHTQAKLCDDLESDKNYVFMLSIKRQWD